MTEVSFSCQEYEATLCCFLAKCFEKTAYFSRHVG